MQKMDKNKDKAFKMLGPGLFDDAEINFDLYLEKNQGDIEPEQIVEDCMEFADKLIEGDMYHIALKYYERILKFYIEKKKLDAEGAELLAKIQGIYHQQEQLLEDEDKNEELERIKAKNRDKSDSLSLLFRLISKRQELLGNFAFAICFKKQELLEKKKNLVTSRQLYNIYHDLGVFYLKEHEYERAKYYLKKCKRQIDDLENKLFKLINVDKLLISAYESLKKREKNYILRKELDGYYESYQDNMGGDMEVERSDHETGEDDESEEDFNRDMDQLLREKKENLFKLSSLARELKKNKEANMYAEKLSEYEDLRQQAQAIKGLAPNKGEGIFEANKMLYQSTFFEPDETIRESTVSKQEEAEPIDPQEILIKRLKDNPKLSKDEFMKILDDCIRESNEEVNKRTVINQKLQERLTNNDEALEKMKTINKNLVELRAAASKKYQGSKTVSKLNMRVKQLNQGIKYRSVQKFNLDFKGVDETYFDYFANESLAIFNMVKIIEDKEFQSNIKVKIFKLNKLLGTNFKHLLQLNKAVNKEDIEQTVWAENVKIENYTYTMLGIGKELSKERFYQIRNNDFSNIKTASLELAQNYLVEDFRLNKENFIIEALARVDAINVLRVITSTGKGFYDKKELGLIAAQKESLYKRVLVADDEPLPSQKHGMQEQSILESHVVESDDANKKKKKPEPKSEPESEEENNSGDEGSESSDDEKSFTKKNHKSKRPKANRQSYVEDVAEKSHKSDDSEESDDEADVIPKKVDRTRIQNSNVNDNSSSSSDEEEERQKPKKIPSKQTSFDRSRFLKKNKPNNDLSDSSDSDSDD